MKAALHNLGCKVNSYETDAMQETLESHGYTIVPFHDIADVYIVNTCSVTNIADRKSRQMLRQAKRRNPDAIIIAAGCYVQTKNNVDEIDESIDIVIGNNKKQDLMHILNEYIESRGLQDLESKPTEPSYHLIDINETSEFEELIKSKKGIHTRSVIKIQDGCNQFCSYCIIPMLRGRVRSRSYDSVIEEVKTLVANGCLEVVLTGIHLSSYGIDLKKQQSDVNQDITMIQSDSMDDHSLLHLIQGLCNIEGLKRVRLGSLEPRIITEEFVSALSQEEKFCPHFHLSLQSGCDETLKRMNRHYTTAEYADKCRLIRKYFTHPAITTDLIVGFPGETEEEYQTTKAFVDSINFYETHVFKFSKREGTKAATMKDQVSSEIKGRRSSELLKLSAEKQRRFEEHLLGKKVEVLIEGQLEVTNMLHGDDNLDFGNTSADPSQNVWYGHTKEYVKLRYESSTHPTNNMENTLQIVEIKDKSQFIH